MADEENMELVPLAKSADELYFCIKALFFLFFFGGGGRMGLGVLLFFLFFFLMCL